MSPNKRESVANKFSIEELQSILDNYKPREIVNKEKNGMYKNGSGEKYKRIWFKGEKIKLSHIVWRINSKKKIPIGYHIHHKDENKRNDSFDNLELVEGIEHGKWNLKGGVNGRTEYSRTKGKCFS